MIIEQVSKGLWVNVHMTYINLSSILTIHAKRKKKQTKKYRPLLRKLCFTKLYLIHLREKNLLKFYWNERNTYFLNHQMQDIYSILNIEYP